LLALPGSNASDQSEPDVSVDGGMAHLVWLSVDGGRSRVFHSSSSDLGNWTTPKTLGPLSPGSDATGPRVSASGGRVYVAWREANATQTSVRFAASLDSGGNFTRTGTVSPTPLAAAAPLNLSIASAGDDLHVAYSHPSVDGGDLVVRSSNNATSGFRPAWTVPGAGAQSSPALAALGSKVLLAWEDARNGEPDIFSSVSSDRGATFSAPAPAFGSQAGLSHRSPAATADAAGRWWLAWEDEEGAGSFANVSMSVDPTEFPEGSRASAQNVSAGTLGFAVGSGHFSGVDGLSGRVVASRRLDDAYAAATRAGNASVAERDPRGASYLGSSSLFVWSDRAGGNEEVRFAALPWRGPTVSIASPLPGSLIGAAGTTVAWSSVDGDGNAASSANLSWSADLRSWTLSAAGLPPSGSSFWRPPPAAQGRIFLRVTSADNPGNRDGAIVEVTADPSAPTAIAFDPAPGSKNTPVGASVSITFSELMDETSVEANFTLAERGSLVSGTFSWVGPRMSFKPGQTGALEGRLYEVRVVGGHDLAGNALPLAIDYDFTTNDTTPPAVSVLSPTGGEQWNLSTRAIRWKTSDAGVIPSGGVDLRYSVDNGTTWSDLALGIDDTAEHNWTLPPTIDTSAARVNVSARDLVGNKGWNASAKFSIDSVVPSVAGSSPSQGETGVKPSVVVRVNISEPVNKSRVSSSAVLQSQEGSTQGTVAWLSDTAFTFTPRQNLTLARKYSLSFTSVDKMNNTLLGNIEFQTEDNRPPTIEIFKPNSTSVVNGVSRFDIAYDIRDDSGELLRNGINISLSLDGGKTYQSIISGWDDNRGYPWLPNGTAESKAALIKVSARDGAGNEGEKVSSAFRFDPVSPHVVSSDPHNGSGKIPVRDPFIFLFSEPMANSTPSVTFSRSAGNLTFGWTGSVLEVAHDKDLPSGQALTVVLTDARDEAGNPMRTPYKIEGTIDPFLQRAHVSGRVVSSEGDLLANVLVQGKNVTTAATVWSNSTGKDGRFSHPDLDPGVYVIEFRLAGYRDTSIQRSLPPGIPVDLRDIVMFPAEPTFPSYLPLYVLLLAVIGLIALFVFISRRMKFTDEGEELEEYLRKRAGEEEESSETGRREPALDKGGTDLEEEESGQPKPERERRDAAD
jgi:hypothetical protein